MDHLADAIFEWWSVLKLLFKWFLQRTKLCSAIILYNTTKMKYLLKMLTSKSHNTVSIFFTFWCLIGTSKGDILVLGIVSEKFLLPRMLWTNSSAGVVFLLGYSSDSMQPTSNWGILAWWLRTCLFRLLFWVNVRWQLSYSLKGQTNGLSLVWILRWS